MQLFLRLSTQWRVGFNGPTGLDYTAVYPLLDRMFPDPVDWDLAFDDVQIIEREALAAIREGQS